ncbi:MAG: DUF697 domain-containing protein [Candidatus Methylumidiphilus sp.]
MTTSDSAAALDGAYEPYEQRLARAERLAGARNLAKHYVLAAAGLGLLPLPLADLVGVMALQIKLVHGLAKHYGVPFQRSLAQSLLASLLSGASQSLLARGFASLAKAVPVLGGLAGGGGVAASAASVTYATGEVFIQHFESGGTLLDIDLEKAKALFKCKLGQGQPAAEAPAEALPEAVAASPAEESPAAESQQGEPEPVGAAAAEGQLEDIIGIGEVYADRLRAAGVASFADLAATPPKRIKEIIGRGFPLSKDTIQSWIQQADDLAHGRHPEPLDD